MEHKLGRDSDLMSIVVHTPSVIDFSWGVGVQKKTSKAPL
jgi:hypothetical protein